MSPAATAKLAARARPVPMGLLHYPGVRCPSCGGRQFEIRRVTAECARCGGALLLTTVNPEGAN